MGCQVGFHDVPCVWLRFLDNHRVKWYVGWMVTASRTTVNSRQILQGHKRENRKFVHVWSIHTSALASWISLSKICLRCPHLSADRSCLWYRYRWLSSSSWARMLYDMIVKRSWYGVAFAALAGFSIT